MTDYIKREDILDRTVKRNSIWNGITNACGQGLEEIVNGIPSADVAPVRHGRWESHTDRYICPICHKEWCFFENDVDMFSYCPHCGAKMDR